MAVLSMLGNFLLSEWLWSMTFAWSYVICSLMMNCFFLWRNISLSLSRSFMVALLATIFSFAFYTLIVVGVFIHLLQWWYVPQEYEMVAGPLRANLNLAIIYTIFNSIFYYFVHRLSGQSWTRLLVIACASNVVAALLSYAYIALMFKDSL